MPALELDWDDLRDIAASCVAPSITVLLDALDRDNLEDVVTAAAEVRDAAQAIVAGRIEGRYS
jgi:hypothetical protein